MVTDAVRKIPDFYRIVYALLFSTLMSIILILIGAERAHSGYFLFLIYNMGLAFLPMLFAWWLVCRLKKNPWLSFYNILITLLWLAFLPNSFYMITDLIHAQQSIGVDLLYNIVIILLCVFNSLVAGYISIYLIHWALLKRFYYRNVHLVIGLVILMCSFAIYLGRYLRWNSWDVVFNPAGLLFDISDSITSPSTHPEVFATTASFFILLVSMYVVIWQIARVLRRTD